MKEVLLNENQIEEINVRLGKQFTELFKNEEKPPVFICVLRGAAPFVMGLIKRIDCPLCIDFVQYSSYNGGTSSTKNLVLKKDISMDIKDRSIVLVDDILDTGETLKIFKEHAQSFGPKKIYTCVLVDKKGRRDDGFFEADFVGATIPNKFVAGYGLDYNELFRNAPVVFVPDEEEIAKADSYGNL